MKIVLSNNEVKKMLAKYLSKKEKDIKHVRFHRRSNKVEDLGSITIELKEQTFK